MQDKKLTIVQVITRLDRGGSAASVLEHCAALSDRGHNVTLISGKTVDPEKDPEDIARQHGFDLLFVPSLLREISPLDDLKSFFALNRIIHKLHPDIVHTHTSKSGIIGRWAARFAGITNIVHSPRGHIFYGYYSKTVTSFFILVELITALITKFITTLTSKGRQDHIDLKIAPASKFRIVHSGVDIERFSSADGNAVRKLYKFDNCQLIGWAGRLADVKNCSLLLDAAEKIIAETDKVRFVIAGDGDERSMLEEKAANLGLTGKVLFLGHREDMPEVMASFDIFMLTSKNEGFGRVLVEAMAAGSVPISTRVGGTADVIEQGISGLLADAGDSEGLAEAAFSLINDRELQETMCNNGRLRAQEFSLKRMVDLFEALYYEMLES